MADTTAPAPAAPAARKIKTSKPRQRACDEKNDKGKGCMGHLKRYYDYPKEIEALVGKGAELYRCERCHTLYRPDPNELPRSFVLRH